MHLADTYLKQHYQFMSSLGIEPITLVLLVPSSIVLATGKLAPVSIKIIKRQVWVTNILQPLKQTLWPKFVKSGL